MSYNPQLSVIEPFEFEYEGTQYAIGAWKTGVFTQPRFSIVRLANDEWKPCGGIISEEFSEDIVDDFGGSQKYIQHHLDNWNKLHFTEEIKVPNGFLEGFEEYMRLNLVFDGQLRLV